MRIADLGSLSRAADRLRVAQPALSRQMRLLEADLGVALFVRHRRGMMLTPAGEELRTRLAGPLRQIDLIVEDVRCLSREVGGHVAFGLSPTVSTVLAGSLAKRVAAEAPNVTLRIVEGYTAHLVDWLQRGEIDVAILYGPAADLQLKAKELLIEDIGLAGPPDSDLAGRDSIAMADLARLPLVLPSHPHGLRVVADHAAAKAGLRLDVSIQADSFLLMKELVETGLGYAMLPLSSIRRDVETGRLQWVPIERPAVRRQLVLATQPGISSRASRTLVRVLRAEIAAMVTDGRWTARLMFDPEAGA